MFLTESWLQNNHHSQLVELCPVSTNHAVSGRGSGQVSVYKKSLKCIKAPCNEFSTFEVLTLKFGGLNPFLLAIIYLPPKPTGSFLAELSEFVSCLVLNDDRVVLRGDFNIHVNDSTNARANEFFKHSYFF